MTSKELEEKAIKFIHMVANSTDRPLYAGNSGGKDSAVVDFLLQKSGIKYQSYYTNTTIDPMGTIGHIRRNYPHTEIIQPKETFYQLIERKGFPTRLNRYCCERLKEYGSVGKVVFEGIRSGEGTRRQGRDYIQCDSRKWQKGSQHVYPIYDWTDEEVWQFIKDNNITLAPAYNKGFKRLGCVGCPLITRKGVRESEFQSHPKMYEAIKQAITRGMKKNPQWKLTVATDGDGELAMKWWLSNKTMNDYFSDYLFEKTSDGWKKSLKNLVS